MSIRVFPVVGPTTICGAWGDVRSGGKIHKGVDICCPKMTPVLAVDDGVIHFGTDPLGGNVAILRTEDGDAYYEAHLASFNGDNLRDVVAGEVVGFADNTGNATLSPTHVHFEWWPDGQYTSTTDPTAQLNAAVHYVHPPVVAPAGVSVGRALAYGAAILAAAALASYAIHPKPARVRSRRLYAPFTRRA